jgi:hypothetical protein
VSLKRALAMSRPHPCMHRFREGLGQPSVPVSELSATCAPDLGLQPEGNQCLAVHADLLSLVGVSR